MTNFKCYLLSEPHKPTIAPAVPKENKRWDGFSPTNVVGGLDSFSVNNLNQYTVVNGNVPNYGGDAILPALPHNIRVRGFNRNPLGRRSRRGRVRSFITPSSRRCGYKTVAGRSAWLNRDPLGDIMFFAQYSDNANLSPKQIIAALQSARDHLYVFVANNPPDNFDALGLRTEDQCQNDCLKYCQYVNDPNHCAQVCFAGCAKDPNYTPWPVPCPPPLKPSPPTGGCLNAIWIIVKNVWKLVCIK